jgi:hypothetical protein
MRTIRRLYFYLIALISVETVIWGSIYLARTIVKTGVVISQTSEMAGGFSLVLVGLPIFLFHWWMAQRDAARDGEERSARIRALFLYAIRLSTLVAIVQSELAILNRLVLQLAQLSPSEAWIGGSDTLADNLIIALINAVALLYFENVLRQDWKTGQSGPAFTETRRLFRYIWMLFTLSVTIVGVQQIFFALFSAIGQRVVSSEVNLANAIATTLAGAPLWAWIWIFIQRRLDQNEESQSLLRLVVLHLLAITGAVTALSTAFILLKDLGIWLTGETNTLNAFIAQHNVPLSLLIVSAVVWVYFDRHLHARISLEDDPIRQASLRRFYNYLLAAVGFGFLFSGMFWLGRVLIDLALNHLGSQALREGLNGSAASMLAGLAFWLKRWMDAQAEARQEGEAGDHARRSLVRKGILYLAVFSGVVGVMSGAGMLFFLLINVALGGQEENFTLELLYNLEILLLVGLWLGYYLVTLIQDGRFAHVSLNQRHAAFPVLAVGLADSFAAELLQTLQRTAPDLPVSCCAPNDLPAAEAFQAARAVVLPLGLATQLPEDLRQRLEGFGGQRIVVPLLETGWVWLGGGRRSERDLARDTAQAVRQLSEGQEARTASLGIWGGALSVLGVLFLIQLLFGIVAFAFSVLIR